MDTATQVADLARIEAYRATLRAIDWSYQYSDDYTEHRKHAALIEQAKAEQKVIDSDKAIWNEVAAARIKRAMAEPAAEAPVLHDVWVRGVGGVYAKFQITAPPSQALTEGIHAARIKFPGQSVNVSVKEVR
jgi:hypothetical protein